MLNFQFLDNIWHQNYKKSKNSKFKVESWYTFLYHQILTGWSISLSWNYLDIIFMENTEMWNKCPRENDLLKCIVVTHGCTGQTSILKVGGESTTYILPPNIGDNNVFLPLLSQKLEGNRPQFLLHRNSTRRVYSSQLEVT